jgi:hypothetical protein
MGQVDSSPIKLLSWARFVEFLLLKGSKHRIICLKQYIGLFDVGMYNVTLGVWKIQSLEQTLKHKG